MVGEAEIVVGAEVDEFAHPLALAHPDAPGLRADDPALAPQEAIGLDFDQPVADVVQQFVRHGNSP